MATSLVIACRDAVFQELIVFFVSSDPLSQQKLVSTLDYPDIHPIYQKEEICFKDIADGVYKQIVETKKWYAEN